MRLRAALTIAGLVVAVLAGDGALGLAQAKSAYYEIKARCPCAGPSARTFWTSTADRLACVDAVLEELRAQGWPGEVLSRDRLREQRSRCGEARLQCDGTANRPCPGRMVCDVVDPNCNPTGATGTCVSPRKNSRGCRVDPYPVCGCDGTTYKSLCRLRRAGVALALPNRCDVACGGPERRPCEAGHYCWTMPTCDAADAVGACVPLDGFCDSSVDGFQVCGCDGATYANLCELAAAPMGLKHRGACASD
jgi:hypothetical protein